ncbi:hypothetical protein [Mycobacterium sp. M26]|uniref:hypothetical protein n=1 Tax=Mycobacterium sp. M26 TaxID=1762962 RepID=UPI000B08A832|nr:hypothetical protein [Mycobacterium sp. M26]
MEQTARNDLKQSAFRTTTPFVRVLGATALSAAVALISSPVALADGHKTGAGWSPPVEIESGAIAGAGGGPTLGVGGPSSYSGGSTSNSLCQRHCGATLGVGGPSSYTGGSTANHPGGTATQGVGDVNSYTGGGTPGTTNNGTNSTTRTGNYGPG